MAKNAEELCKVAADCLRRANKVRLIFVRHPELPAKVLPKGLLFLRLAIHLAG